MNQIPRLAVCCAATGAVAVAGCGGSSSSGLSKAQLAAKARHGVRRIQPGRRQHPVLERTRCRGRIPGQAQRK